MVTLMRTKYRIPPLSPHLIRGERIRAHMERDLWSGGAFARRLTLISAPVGYGKTTAAVQWLGECHWRVAWVTLDSGDNDSGVFWSYVLRALSEVDDGVGGASASYLAAGSSQLASMNEGSFDYRRFVRRLINELYQLEAPVILVLDDYHSIEEREIHNGVSYFLEHLPPTTHVVLITRADPPVNLGRVRGRGDLLEVREQDLRLGCSSIREFIRRTTGRQLSSDDLQRLARRTRGWVAGLQIFAASVQGHQDVSGMIDNLTRDNRYILEYLMDEVLEQQPCEVRDFLLWTSPLDRFTASLCDRVVQRDSAREMIMRLHRENLFILQMDEAGRWHRYHPLFARLLRNQMKGKSREEYIRILCAAAAWYEERELIPEALEALISAGEYADAADLLERWIEQIWHGGQSGRLIAWLDALPAARIKEHRRLAVFYSFLLLINLRPAEIRPFLDAADMSDGEAGSDGQASLPRMTGEEMDGMARAVRAHLAGIEGDEEEFLSSARGVMKYFEKRRSAWRPFAALIAADAREWVGDESASERMWRMALEDGRSGKDPLFCLGVAHRLGMMKLRTARLKDALDICREQLRFAGDMGFADAPRAAALWSIRGEARREQNELEKAAAHLQRAASLSEDAVISVRAWVQLYRLRFMLSTGEYAGAEEVLQHLEREVYGLVAFMDGQIAVCRAKLELRRGNCSRAERLLEPHLDAEEPLGPWYDDIHLMGARVHLARGAMDEARQILDSMSHYCEKRGSRRAKMETALLYSILSQAEGDVGGALRHLKPAMHIAEPEGYVRLFLDEGEAVYDLLLRARRQGVSISHVDGLLAAFGDEGKPAVAAPSGDAVENLSAREIEILRLVAAGFSNREVGERLYISENTVKWHTSNIYSKMGVSNRTEAVNLARETGLLQE